MPHDRGKGKGNPGLNQGPLDLQSNALPTELFRPTRNQSPLHRSMDSKVTGISNFDILQPLLLHDQCHFLVDYVILRKDIKGNHLGTLVVEFKGGDYLPL